MVQAQTGRGYPAVAVTLLGTILLLVALPVLQMVQVETGCGQGARAQTGFGVDLQVDEVACFLVVAEEVATGTGLQGFVGLPTVVFTEQFYTRHQALCPAGPLQLVLKAQGKGVFAEVVEGADFPGVFPKGVEYQFVGQVAGPLGADAQAAQDFVVALMAGHFQPVGSGILGRLLVAVVGHRAGDVGF